MFLTVLLIGQILTVGAEVTTDDSDIRLVYGDERIVEMRSNGSFYLQSEHGTDRVWVNCTHGSLATKNCRLDVSNGSVWVNITSQAVGVDFLSDKETNKTITRVQIIRSEGVYIFNQITGWIYFVAWTVSFYPQIWLNFKRKSVEGLNFDYVLLNVIGFACYTVFNWALYFSSTIFALYEEEHHDGVNPVEINDVSPHFGDQ